MRRSQSTLNQKDLTIQSLQAQLSESAHTAQEIAFIQTQLQNLQHRYSLLQNQHLNSKCLIQSKIEASEKTISHLKAQIQMLETQLREKQIILSDYQHQSTSLKDQRIARDDQSEMLRYESEGLRSDGQTLQHELGKLQNTRLIYDNQLRQIQSDLVQLEQTKLTISQKISNAQRQKQSLKIEAERLTTILHNYEAENMKLSQQLRQLEEEEKGNLSQIACIREQLISEELLQTQLENRLAKARNEIDQTQAAIREEKEKSKEIICVIRSKAAYKDSLQASIQNELKQKNFLLGKNAQIVQINEKLKTDLTLCQAHLGTLKASVDSQKQLIERLSRQDQKIIQIIQNRQGLKESRSNNKLSISRATGFNFV